MENSASQNLTNIQDISKNWFDEMVAHLRYDEQLFHNDIMDDDKKEFYNVMMDGNVEAMSSIVRNQSSTYFITRLIKDYFKELISSKKTPKRIAVELSDSKVLVWAEIYSNDEEMENALILSQAKINAQYSKFGFNISSTIVEDCDNLQIPNHYKSIPIT